MKKINSIWFGSRVIIVAGIFILVIPAFLYMIDKFVIRSDILIHVINASFAIGIVILLLFSLILIIEFRQDKRINKMYNKVKYEKIEVSRNKYECQYCGYQKVQEKDSYCKMCGTKFIQ